MQEVPFYFSSGSNELFGIIHKPTTKTNHFGFVLCSPFAEEKLWAHRVYVNFARKLASLGYTVLRFDYSGHGDSEGDFIDSTVRTRINDILSAIKILRKMDIDVNEVGLLGLRFGATLAAMVAEEKDSIRRLILWEPIVSGKKYMQTLFRTNITTQTAIYKEIRFNTKALIKQLQEGHSVNIKGYDILLPLYEQIIDISLTDSKRQFKGNALIVSINKRAGMDNKKDSSSNIQYSKVKTISVVEQPFWKEIKEYYYCADNLFDATLHWLKDEI